MTTRSATTTRRPARKRRRKIHSRRAMTPHRKRMLLGKLVHVCRRALQRKFCRLRNRSRRRRQRMGGDVDEADKALYGKVQGWMQQYAKNKGSPSQIAKEDWYLLIDRAYNEAGVIKRSKDIQEMATLLSQAPVTVPYAPSLTLPAGTVPVTSPMVGYGHQLPYPNTAKRMNTNERSGWKKNLATAGAVAIDLLGLMSGGLSPSPTTTELVQLPFSNTGKRVNTAKRVNSNQPILNTNERRGWKKNLETAGYAVGGLLISALIVAAMGAAIAHGAVVNLPDLNFNGWGSSGSHSRDSRPNPQQQPV